MTKTPTNEHTETCLRECLKKEGYDVSRRRGMGETGVDILAKKDGKEYHIEVIGFKKSPPQRTKDFCVVFFGAISRLKDGAKKSLLRFQRDLGMVYINEPIIMVRGGKESEILFQNLRSGLFTVKSHILIRNQNGIHGSPNQSFEYRRENAGAFPPSQLTR